MFYLGKLILRVGLAIVFLYFGISQIINPWQWTGLLPQALVNYSQPQIFIYFNGVFDILIGLGFLSGFFIRISSILGFLHLLGIALFVLGINSPSGIRDLGLALAALSLFFLKN